MKRNKNIFFSIYVLFYVFGLSGCTAKNGSAETAENLILWAFWGAETRVNRSQEAINIYQSQNPQIKIVPQVSLETGEHFSTIDTQLAGGRGPDIIQMGGNIREYARLDALLPLDEFTDTKHALPCKFFL